jgi:hypothetical protein
MGKPGWANLSRVVLASAFLAWQIVMVFYAQKTPSRFFCWAPNDRVTDYVLEVKVGGRDLTPNEILHRYRIPGGKAVRENMPYFVISIVQQYEETYGRDEHAEVRLRWTTNGHGPEESWQWPPR